MNFSSASLKLQSLTSTRGVCETEGTLAAFQGFDTLGSVSSTSHYYSNSEDKQGQETKRQKSDSMTSKPSSSLSTDTQFIISFSHFASYLVVGLWRASRKLSARWPAAKAHWSLTKQADLFSWHSWGIMTSCHRSKKNFCPLSPKWDCLCSLGNQHFKKHKNTSSATAIRDAIDFLIKSHKGPISVREVMYDGIKPIPSHFCVLWGFNRSVLISCY